tara:strand:- start:403 stop:657 length:255 start_codon:yes stop_codon:yes gene_type:complete
MQTQPQIPEETIELWKNIVKKSNWRIVELPNGFYQTECLSSDKWEDVTRRETVEGAERAIDSSIEHYKKKLKALEGPKVVKTFK